MRIALIALLALAACDEAATPASSAPEVGGNVDVAMQSAAEKECAQMTGYSAEKLQATTAEMKALLEREYKSCVAKVTAGGN
jgi:hypothetical protein